MKLSKYVNDRGLVLSHVASKMKRSRQQLDQYDENRLPTLRIAVKIAESMTELGAPTTIADLTTALMREG